MNSDQNGESDRYRQLGLFSIIVAEMTLLPGGLAALAYYLTRNSDPLGIGWKVWTGVGAGLGFGVAFYRIYLLNKQLNKKDGQ